MRYSNKTIDKERDSWGCASHAGVFYNLNEVALGDEVVVTTASGQEFRYRGVCKELLVANESTLAEATGSAEDSLLTLITRGGEWDAGAQTDLHRTVVQAKLMA